MGPSLNTAMEMHDSVILEHEQDGSGDCVLLFSAVVFRAEGEPGASLPRRAGGRTFGCD